MKSYKINKRIVNCCICNEEIKTRSYSGKIYFCKKCQKIKVKNAKIKYKNKIYNYDNFIKSRKFINKSSDLIKIGFNFDNNNLKEEYDQIKKFLQNEYEKFERNVELLKNKFKFSYSTCYTILTLFGIKTRSSKEFHIDKWKKEEFREKRKNTIEEKYKDPNNVYKSKEFKEKIRKITKERWKNKNDIFNNIEYRNRRKEIYKDPKSTCYTEEFKEKIRKITKERWKNKNDIFNNIEYRKNISIKIKNMWADSNSIFHSQKYKKARNLKPNKEEFKLINLFKDNNLNYEYVGDFSLIINGKNPDFVNKDNNKIIEFFGNYWHSEKVKGIPEEQHEKERIEHFEKLGYKTLIIWERELKDIENVKEKILEFNSL